MAWCEVVVVATASPPGADRHGFGHGADLELQRSDSEPVVREDHSALDLERLEALHLDADRVGPGHERRKSNTPTSLVAPFRASPVLSLRMVTPAAGIACPESSTTVPDIEPDVVCAEAGAAQSHITNNTNSVRYVILPPFKLPPPRWRTFLGDGSGTQWALI
jgi:hypothetical protein